MKLSLPLMLCLAVLLAPSRVSAQEKRGAFVVGEVAVEAFVPPVATKEAAGPEQRIESTVEHRLPGRKVTIHRIAPPDLSAFAVAQRPELPPVPVDAALQALFEKNGQVFLSVSATVYDHAFTSLRWWYEGRQFHAWSNVDFFHLSMVANFVADEQPYSLYMGMGEGWVDDPSRAEGLAALAKLPAGEPNFVVVEGDANDAAALRSIVALHKLYAAEGGRLKDAYAKRVLADTEQRAWLEANPPKVPDTVMYYWSPEGKDIPRNHVPRVLPKRQLGQRPSAPVRDAVRDGTMQPENLQAPRQ